MIRFSDTRGEKHPLARLRREQVLEIRRRRQAGEGTRHLAKEFLLSQDYVRKICRGLAWRWLI